MSVFIERFVLAVFVGIFLANLLTNPLHWDFLQRVGIGLLIVGAAIFAGQSMENLRRESRGEQQGVAPKQPSPSKPDAGSAAVPLSTPSATPQSQPSKQGGVKPAPSATGRELAPDVAAEPLPLSVVPDTIEDKRSTRLQKSQFMDRNKGRLVAWEGIAVRVQKAWEHEENSDIMLLVSPVGDNRRSPRTAIITFSATEGAALAQVNAGDLVVAEGRLDFTATSVDWIACLRNARFIRKEMSHVK